MGINDFTSHFEDFSNYTTAIQVMQVFYPMDKGRFLYYNTRKKGSYAMEWILSGYCRTQDQARSVFLEEDEGDWDWGCDFPGCAFSESCTIAKQLRQIQEERK